MSPRSRGRSGPRRTGVWSGARACDVTPAGKAFVVLLPQSQTAPEHKVLPDQTKCDAQLVRVAQAARGGEMAGREPGTGRGVRCASIDLSRLLALIHRLP